MLLKNSFSKYSIVVTTFLVGGFLAGCSSKYSSYSYGGGSYKKIPPQEMKNSQAMHRATMRPYQISGKWYYPTLAKVADEQRGIASWYGPNFHAKKTSNGEIYNMYAMTAAHKTLPMNTMVKVDNLENGRSIVVRINDRGPFVTGRIIDLSNKAAHAIDMVKNGTAKVKITVLGFHGKIAKTSIEKNEVMSVGKYYVQVGAFRRIEGAQITKRKFENIIGNNYNVIIKEGYFENAPINRVWVSGFRSEEEANDFKAKLGINGAMIIAQ
ncbi:septal ring lytic transglycosylase RlpA family protein [Malaciobacter mytili]|nr:septal ring lytic transglycosylase [Malaciobacter mytili LMG 24559]